MTQPACTNQRIELNAADFGKLVRGEIVTQGVLQVALQNVGADQMYEAVLDAVALDPRDLWPPKHDFTLREDEEEVRRWIYGINQAEPSHPGGFLEAFAATVCRADSTNYPLLRPALLALKAKFPKYRFTGDL